MNEELFQSKMHTPLGEIFLVASGRGLRKVFWTEDPAVPYLGGSSENSPIAKILEQSRNQISEYLAGQRSKFDMPLDLAGTPFQLKVWNELLKINYGETKSYKHIASAIATKAIRAVGSANGKNPLCVVIPCHRVIASNGSLGGFSGGLKNKEFLLSLERAFTHHCPAH